ncbi:hypothetical protein KBY58_11485 [Cyanobium sp. HWJ4-Hawea]|uniref:hypothetical protein n=1 Tax=Cyanobium sp. HWJ4-Hawea TaxID=2823713 RepID=UPI0020CFAFA1|nr:hypothetical protein [Cyanobium sp. HWJ4-Hawea]MCP9810056.1 hypothetical protein [Cyanobium sp. HWJ4-Hawea]
MLSTHKKEVVPISGKRKNRKAEAEKNLISDSTKQMTKGTRYWKMKVIKRTLPAGQQSPPKGGAPLTKEIILANIKVHLNINTVAH